MEIRVPKNFRHAGDLSARFASNDPRLPSFADQNVDINLRDCEFVWPAAVLWCAVYSLLARARGSECRLVVPDNMGVCVYLKSIGLFSVLQGAGIEVDDLGVRVPRGQQQHILPVTRFEREEEVEELANQALDGLSRAGLGSANLYPLVSEVFAELAMNAVQHSESPIGSLGLIQFYEFQQGQRFVCVVSDGGIGIRRSLERNPALRDEVLYDWVAIQMALRERVSGTGIATRGIGLYGVAEDMRKSGRQLILHSGIGMVETTEEMESRASRTTLFPGTLAYASIPA
jgi:anti-sigma regulatory factor (Ser/Thr protein kinase)